MLHRILSNRRHLDWNPRSDLVPVNMTGKQVNEIGRHLHHLADKETTKALSTQLPQVEAHKKFIVVSNKCTKTRLHFTANVGQRLRDRAQGSILASMEGIHSAGEERRRRD